ncbi:MAG: hypothetical protein ACREOO_28520 [bacterium]
MTQSGQAQRAAPEGISAVNTEKILIAPAPVMAVLAAASRDYARIDHCAALRTKAHRRIRTAMI